jgi:hypothetical protein
MKHLITATRSAVGSQNWYSALSLALTFPDICGWVEDPCKGSTARAIAWFNTNLAPSYTRTLADGRVHTFLSGEDCYALRCAFLHEGSMEISSQRVQKALDDFVFITPRPDWNMVHMNQSGKRLQLQVDVFAEELCVAVESWLTAIASNPTMISRIQKMGRIYDSTTREVI